MDKRFNRDGFFIGSEVITFDPLKPTAEAVVVRNGRIVAVGSTNQLKDLALGLPTVELGGGTLLPGFVDGHCHFEMATTVGIDWIHVHTPPYKSLHEIGQAIARESERRPGSSWLLCRSSFSMHEKVEENRLFIRQELDEICPDRPMAVFASLHVCSLNTLALKGLGLWEPDSIHPEHGVIHREPNGLPTGVVTEAFLLLPSTVSEKTFKGAVVAAAEGAWNAVGTTTVHTLPESLEQAEWERDLHRNRELSLRQRHYFIAPALGSIAEIAELRGSYFDDVEMVQFGGVKLFANGCAHDGYGNELDDAKWTQDELDAVVLDAHGRGLQLWIHSLNARGVRMSAVAIARAVSRIPGAHRHRIEHGGDFIDLADLDVIKDSGALLVTTPQFLYSMSSSPSAKFAPWRSLIDHGIQPIGATDSTGTVPSSVSILRNAAAAVGRLSATGTPIGIDEAVTPREALEMFSTWSSYGGFEDMQKGMIRAGHFADFALLDKNPLAADEPAQIADIQVKQTYIGGEMVYCGRTLD